MTRPTTNQQNWGNHAVHGCQPAKILTGYFEASQESYESSDMRLQNWLNDMEKQGHRLVQVIPGHRVYPNTGDDSDDLNYSRDEKVDLGVKLVFHTN